MAAKGTTYPWQRLKRLEEHVEYRREDFTKTFFSDNLYVQYISFMSDGLIVQVMDDMTGDVTFKYVAGKAFKSWLWEYHWRGNNE